MKGNLGMQGTTCTAVPAPKSCTKPTNLRKNMKQSRYVKRDNNAFYQAKPLPLAPSPQSASPPSRRLRLGACYIQQECYTHRQ